MVSILLAEDDWLIGALVEQELLQCGYDVTYVQTADLALKVLQSRPNTFDLLLTDIRMPGHLNGWALARQVRSVEPNIRVIYMSGDSQGSWRSEGVADSVFLQKPVLMGVLAKVVAEALNEDAAVSS